MIVQNRETKNLIMPGPTSYKNGNSQSVTFLIFHISVRVILASLEYFTNPSKKMSPRPLLLPPDEVSDLRLRVLAYDCCVLLYWLWVYLVVLMLVFLFCFVLIFNFTASPRAGTRQTLEETHLE